MITKFEVTRALNRLAAIYGKPQDLGGTMREYEGALVRETLRITPAELDEAVTRYIARVERSYGFPTVAAIRAEVMLHRNPTGYVEPDGPPPADGSYVRQVWSKYVDLAELERANRAMKLRNHNTEDRRDG